MIKTKPNADFIKKLNDLVWYNDHTGAKIEIALWCKNECTNNAEHKEDAVWFGMFYDMFQDMNRAHNTNGHFPFGELRYKVYQEMLEHIKSVFGEKVESIFSRI